MGNYSENNTGFKYGNSENSVGENKKKKWEVSEKGRRYRKTGTSIEINRRLKNKTVAYRTQVAVTNRIK